MLRQERQTVAMELAAALHHSRDVGPGTNDGLRAQTTASSGKRLAPLEEVAEPQVSAVTVGYVAAPGPLFVVASLAGGDEVDSTTVSFLLRENLMLQKIKEEEEKERTWREQRKVMKAEFMALMALPSFTPQDEGACGGIGSP